MLIVACHERERLQRGRVAGAGRAPLWREGDRLRRGGAACKNSSSLVWLLQDGCGSQGSETSTAYWHVTQTLVRV